MPIYPKPGAAAIRIIVRGIKASQAPLEILPGLTLNGADGQPTPQAEEVLRRNTAIPLSSAN